MEYTNWSEPEESAGDMVDKSYQVNDIDYASAKKTTGQPVLYLFEKDEKKQTRFEAENWNDDLPGDHDVTAQNDHEEKLHHLKTDTKKDD